MSRVSPVIIVGMHRSGTSLVSRIVHSGGVNMGSRQSGNAESIPFRAINERLLRQADASWTSIGAVERALSSESAIRRLVETVDTHIDRAVKKHTGRFGDPQARWGFKDPRTTLFVPVWSHIFPRARWIYVVRNGVDVAVSLNRRAEEQAKRLRQRVLRRYFYDESLLDLDRCFQLWVEYVELFDLHRSAIPGDQLLEVRYENLLSQPKEWVSRLFAHTGSVRGDVEAAARLIHAPRSRQADGRTDSLLGHPKLAELGYGD